MGVEILIDRYNEPDAEYIRDWMKKYGKFIDYIFINKANVFRKVYPLIKDYADKIPLIYQGHDIHYLRLERMIELKDGDISAGDVKDMKKLELSIWKKANIVLYFSDTETEIVKSHVPDAKTLAVPLFLYSDFEKINYIPSERKDVLFVGGFNHTPNADAMRWYIKDVLPLVLKDNPNIKLHIVGSNCPEDIIGMASDNVVIHGYVSDEELNDLYNKSKIVIAPLRYGAGVKGKIIEAMKNQIPVITTTIGAEGINSDLLTVADSEEDFAQAILDLYKDDAKLTYIAENSYNFVKDNLSENFIDKLLEYIDTQLDTNTPSKELVLKN